MKNRVVNFKYANEEQKNFLEHLESNHNIKYPNETLNVPMWLVLALHSKLSRVLNASKLNKFWDKSEINKTHLLEEFGGLLSHIANLANFLELELMTEISEINLTSPETIFNQFYYRITTLNWSKRHARNTLINQIVPNFVELVYSFGFNLDEVKEAYYRNMQHNYASLNQGE